MIEEDREMEHKLRAAFAQEPVPTTLWPRIQASLTKVEAANARFRLQRMFSSRALMPIAAMLLLVFAGIGLLARDSMVPGMSQSQVAMVPLEEFRTFEASGRPLDFTSTEPAAVRQWFLAKVDLPLPFPVAETLKAHLTGGRLCYFLDRRVASFMYMLDGQSLSLYVMSAVDLPVPPRTDAEVVHDDEYTAVLWSQGDLAYVLVSRLTGDRALQLLRGLAPPTQA